MSLSFFKFCLLVLDVTNGSWDLGILAGENVTYTIPPFPRRGVLIHILEDGTRVAIGYDTYGINLQVIDEHMVNWQLDGVMLTILSRELRMLPAGSANLKFTLMSS